MADKDPEVESPEEEVAEEEEEEEVEDPMPALREKCGTVPECAKLKVELDTCNDRVNSRSNTAETCHQEVVDYMICVDKCAIPKVFDMLK